MHVPEGDGRVVGLLMFFLCVVLCVFVDYIFCCCRGVLSYVIIKRE